MDKSNIDIKGGQTECSDCPFKRCPASCEQRFLKEFGKPCHKIDVKVYSRQEITAARRQVEYDRQISNQKTTIMNKDITLPQSVVDTLDHHGYYAIVENKGKFICVVGDSYEAACETLWYEQCDMLMTCLKPIIFYHDHQAWQSDGIVSVLHYVFDHGHISFEDALWNEIRGAVMEEYTMQSFENSNGWTLESATDGIFSIWKPTIKPWDVTWDMVRKALQDILGPLRSSHQYGFFLINPNTDARLLPRITHESINNNFEEEKALLAHLCQVNNPAHDCQYYADRIVAATIWSSNKGWQNAVCCIANSGESPHGLGTHNILMDDGEEYIYTAEDGTRILYNHMDEKGETFYRIHEFDY